MFAAGPQPWGQLSLFPLLSRLSVFSELDRSESSAHECEAGCPRRTFWLDPSPGPSSSLWPTSGPPVKAMWRHFRCRAWLPKPGSLQTTFLSLVGQALAELAAPERETSKRPAPHGRPLTYHGHHKRPLPEHLGCAAVGPSRSSAPLKGRPCCRGELSGWGRCWFGGY